jgi:hypothetical protein
MAEGKNLMETIRNASKDARTWLRETARSSKSADQEGKQIFTDAGKDWTKMEHHEQAVALANAIEERNAAALQRHLITVAGYLSALGFAYETVKASADQIPGIFGDLARTLPEQLVKLPPEAYLVLGAVCLGAAVERHKRVNYFRRRLDSVRLALTNESN